MPKAWSELSPPAKALRVGHAAVGIIELGCLGYIWACALARRRDRLLGAAFAVLAVQGAGMVVGRGNCPLGPLQRQLGDSSTLFELILPPRAARAAFPVLLTVALGGVLALALRPPISSTDHTAVRRS
jgi:hypothetical protein